MSLSGALFLILLAVGTVAAFAAAVLLWPRLAKRGLRALSGRVAVLALAQTMLLATAAAGANDYFGFYSSWNDLAGLASASDNGPAPAAVSAAAPLAGGSLGTPIKVEGSSGLDIPGGGDPKGAGQLENVTVFGQRTGLSAQVIVYLPPQYFQARYAAARFPAVIVSSGYPGNVQKLVTLLRYPQRLALGIRSGEYRPMVLIMMSPMIVPGRDTECTDVPDGGPQAETFWAQDVPAAIERTYRVTAAARGWGLIGDSTGGYCALKIAMMNSDAFSAAVSLSGYFGALQDDTTGALYGPGNDQPFRNENDLMWRIEHLPSPPIAALLSSSKVGEDNYLPTLAFTKAAKPPMRVSTLIRAQGGHNFNTWNAEVPAGLLWLSQQIGGALQM